MVRTLLRVVLLLIVIAAVAAFFIGYRTADRNAPRAAEHAVGTAGEAGDSRTDQGRVSIDRARETGARIGASVAEGANRAEHIARDAALTTKIKSKMALDDIVKAADIDVDTTDRVVTLQGTVDSTAEHHRAVQLAQETDGVISVRDRLTLSR